MLPVGRRTWISAQPRHEHTHSWRMRRESGELALVIEMGLSSWGIVLTMTGVVRAVVPAPAPASEDVDSVVSGLLPRRESASNEPEFELKGPSLELCRCKWKRCCCCWGGGSCCEWAELGAFRFVDEVDVDVSSVLSESWALLPADGNEEK